MAGTSWFDFRADVMLNLHHVMYAEAWRVEEQETGAAAGAQLVRDNLELRRTIRYQPAVDYYRSAVIHKDLLFDGSMRQLASHIVGRSGSVPDGWFDIMRPLLDAYAATDWILHQEWNLAWTREVTSLLTNLLPEVMPRLEDLFRQTIPDAPILVSTVVVGRTGPAYTTIRPTHITCSTSHRKSQGLAATEIVIHEACHAIAEPLRAALDDRVAASVPHGSELWHVVLFYLTGEVVARAWNRSGVDYRPYLDATGLFERAWPQFQVPVRDAWSGYLEAKTSWDQCCDQLAAAVNP